MSLQFEVIFNISQNTIVMPQTRIGYSSIILTKSTLIRLSILETDSNFETLYQNTKHKKSPTIAEL